MNKKIKIKCEQRRWKNNNISLTTYQDSRDRDLRLKQRRMQPLTPAVYIERQEVATNDGYRLIDDLDVRPPHELHLIKKTSGVRGEPYWIRDALAELGFKSKRHNEWQVVYTIQPNTGRVNQLLWLCKHLVKVTPVKVK